MVRLGFAQSARCFPRTFDTSQLDIGRSMVIIMQEFTGYKRGINLGGWLSQCEPNKEHYDSFISESDIKRIAEWGLDHVRLPIDYELVANKDGAYIEEGFQYIDDCLEWCHKYGLNMILDLHKTAGYTFDETVNEFFVSQQLQDRFIALWEQLAKRYGRYNDCLTFELLNEVVELNVAELWNSIIQRAIECIRKYSPSIKIIVGGVQNNSIFTLKLLDKPYDENIVYTFHFYDPLIFTHQSAYWVDKMPEDFTTEYPNDYHTYLQETKNYLPDVHLRTYQDLVIDRIDQRFFESVFAEAIDLCRMRNVPLYCGEYGVIDRAGLASTVNWYSDIYHTFEKYGMSRAAWTYKGKDFGITDDHYSSILDTLINLL